MCNDPEFEALLDSLSNWEKEMEEILNMLED